MELDQLHKKLRRHLENQEMNWDSHVYGQEIFYQGFDRIGITGCRPTEKRFQRYDILDFLSKEKSALDIGSNCGFLTLHFSDYLKSIDGVELNPFLVSIANDTKSFLNITNTQFTCSSFEDFRTEKQYDLIFSFANDSTIDGNTKFNFMEYILKVYNLLPSSGLLVFESQAQDSLSYSLFHPKKEILKKYFEIVVDKKVPSNFPTKVPERYFLVLKKQKKEN
tara:strand:+ start:265 stop:930 length:666 start_codon:yes stop_codon:yes gene_type:complete